MGQQENEPLINSQPPQQPQQPQQPQPVPLAPQQQVYGGYPQQPQPVYGYQPTYDPYQPQSQGYVYPQQPQYGYSNSAVVVTEECHSNVSHHHSNHTTGALIILILGIFFTPIWLLGLIYIRSHNKTARSLGITSVCLFAVCVLIVIIAISASQ